MIFDRKTNVFLDLIIFISHIVVFTDINLYEKCYSHIKIPSHIKVWLKCLIVVRGYEDINKHFFLLGMITFANKVTFKDSKYGINK